MLHAIVFVCALLLVGVWLRQQVAWFRLGLIPASLIAGFLGLAVIQWFHWNERDTMQPIVSALGPWPSTLIAVVFAAMLLGKSPQDPSSTNRHLVRDVMQQGLMVWIIVLGQTVVGLWVTWLWVGPQFDLPSSAGMLIETGFAGGHGTAAAMGDVFKHASIGWDEGLDLGVMMATGGLVYGLVSGIIGSNWPSDWDGSKLKVPPRSHPTTHLKPQTHSKPQKRPTNHTRKRIPSQHQLDGRESMEA